MPGEKTQDATPKRRRDARQRGQVARSQDLSGVLVLLGGLLLLRLTGPSMLHGVSNWMGNTFSNLDTEGALGWESVTGGQGNGLLLAAQILLPFLAGILLVSVAANVLQTGPLLSMQPLKPQLSRISPLAGAKRILSKQGLISLLRNLAKLAIVGAVLTLGIQAHLDDILALGTRPLATDASELALLVFDIVLLGALALLLLGVADFAWQRKYLAMQLRMSFQDVQDEFKQTDGDPHVRNRQRQKRRDMFNRMLANVPRASVVVTNPTHLAIALRYDPLEGDAPIVLAKGERLMAARIRAVAEEHGVPILEDKPLARALFVAARVGKPIPAHLFQAVAEILAFVFRLRAGLPARPPAPHDNLEPASWARRA